MISRISKKFLKPKHKKKEKKNLNENHYFLCKYEVYYTIHNFVTNR